MNAGLKEEKKVLNFVKSILDENTQLIKSNSKEENLFDFKLINNSKSYLFEIYSPEQDFNIFCDKFKTARVAIFGKRFLKFAIINKYYKQFKNNPYKFLIINLNNDGNLGSVNLNYRKNKISRIAKIFSCPVLPDGYLGLFHNNTIKITDHYLSKEIISIKIEHLKKIKGVITYINDSFIEFIINPYSNITKDEKDFIINLLKPDFVTLNKKSLSEDENSINVLSEENKYKKIFDNIKFKILKKD